MGLCWYSFSLFAVEVIPRHPLMQRFSETLLNISLGGGSDYEYHPLLALPEEKEGNRKCIHARTLNEIRTIDPSVRAIQYQRKV
jgi:hypothetical protein